MIEISIIVPLYKGAQYIRSIIEGIENNTNIDCLKTEIIFVNDYPQDFFKKANYNSRINIEFLNHRQNKGIHQTKIDGFKKSKGRYILFLDQDDTIGAHYFDSQLQKIGNHDAVFCNGFRRQGEPIYSPDAMKTDSFDLEYYILYGYTLISLGQLLIRREAVPQEWSENPMKNNGWDDHFFWVCMMQKKRSIVYNEAYLYIHQEAENNASFDWKAMKNSAAEFKDKVVGLNIFNKKEEEDFKITIEKRITKYEKYMELDRLADHIKAQEINDYLCVNSIHSIAVYGIGVYGKKFCQMIDPRRILIKYGIDKEAEKKKMVFPVYGEVRSDIEVDCIVCATGFEDENLKRKLPGRVLTLKKILKEGRKTG